MHALVQARAPCAARRETRCRNVVLEHVCHRKGSTVLCVTCCEQDPVCRLAFNLNSVVPDHGEKAQFNASTCATTTRTPGATQSETPLAHPSNPGRAPRGFIPPGCFTYSCQRALRPPQCSPSRESLHMSLPVGHPICPAPHPSRPFKLPGPHRCACHPWNIWLHRTGSAASASTLRTCDGALRATPVASL